MWFIRLWEGSDDWLIIVLDCVGVLNVSWLHVIYPVVASAGGCLIVGGTGLFVRCTALFTSGFCHVWTEGICAVFLVCTVIVCGGAGVGSLVFLFCWLFVRSVVYGPDGNGGCECLYLIWDLRCVVLCFLGGNDVFCGEYFAGSRTNGFGDPVIIFCVVSADEGGVVCFYYAFFFPDEF